jgi:hypothetical protein
MKYIQLGMVTRKPILAFQIMNLKKGRIQYIDNSMAKELIKIIDTMLATKQITELKHNYYKARILLGLEESKDYRWVKNMFDREKYKMDKYYIKRTEYDMNTIIEELFLDKEVKK